MKFIFFCTTTYFSLNMPRCFAFLQRTKKSAYSSCHNLYSKFEIGFGNWKKTFRTNYFQAKEKILMLLKLNKDGVLQISVLGYLLNLDLCTFNFTFKLFS